MTKDDSPKLRVALVYGGHSTEHEISLESAGSVLRNLDQARYEIVPVYVDQHGAFHRHVLPLPAAGRALELPVGAGATGATLAARGGQLFASDGGHSCS